MAISEEAGRALGGVEEDVQLVFGPDGDRARERPLSQFECAGCGYGASRSSAPERCPMCGGSDWDFAPWRPFTRSPLI
jgi:rubrerythrin